jgi:hypothetical protein
MNTLLFECLDCLFRWLTVFLQEAERLGIPCQDNPEAGLAPARRHPFFGAAGGFPAAWPAHMRKSGFLRFKSIMEIERINAIGTLLADLTARTAALRGYL